MFPDVDYHIHTYFSDGDMSPEELVDRYIDRGYTEIAITDHDEIEGSLMALWYSFGKDISVVPGIELSTRDEHGNTIHMLGYGINYSCPELRSAISKIRLWRAERNDRLLAKLNEMGYDITIDELFSVNDGRFIGKPTFAKLLVRRGAAEDEDAVFKNFFSREEFRGLSKRTLSTNEAIELIHSAGGNAVFAHPMELRRKGEAADDFYERVRNLIDEMIENGLDGIECYHPSATMIEAEMLRNIARFNNLYVTKGSDFHSDSVRRDYEG